MIQSPEVVSRTSILDGLSSNQIQKLKECSTVIRFRPGDRLIEQGKRADRFFFIQSGLVSIEVYSPERGPKPLQQVGKGGLLGSSSWIEPHKWQFDARAVEPTEALVFNTRLVKEKCDEDSELSSALLKRFFIAVTQRLDATQKQLMAVYSAKER